MTAGWSRGPPETRRVAWRACLPPSGACLPQPAAHLSGADADVSGQNYAHLFSCSKGHCHEAVVPADHRRRPASGRQGTWQVRGARWRGHAQALGRRSAPGCKASPNLERGALAGVGQGSVQVAQAGHARHHVAILLREAGQVADICLVAVKLGKGLGLQEVPNMNSALHSRSTCRQTEESG